MSIITKMRKQQAYYWTNGTNNGFGKSVYSSATLISCRWEEIQKEISNKNGEKEVSQATVYVDRDVQTGGYLALYDISITPSSNPEDIEQAFRIIHFESLPNLKNSESLKTAYL